MSSRVESKSGNPGREIVAVEIPATKDFSHSYVHEIVQAANTLLALDVDRESIDFKWATQTIRMHLGFPPNVPKLLSVLVKVVTSPGQFQFQQSGYGAHLSGVEFIRAVQAIKNSINADWQPGMGYQLWCESILRCLRESNNGLLNPNQLTQIYTILNIATTSEV